MSNGVTYGWVKQNRLLQFKVLNLQTRQVTSRRRTGVRRQVQYEVTGEAVEVADHTWARRDGSLRRHKHKAGHVDGTSWGRGATISTFIIAETENSCTSARGTQVTPFIQSLDLPAWPLSPNNTAGDHLRFPLCNLKHLTQSWLMGQHGAGQPITFHFVRWMHRRWGGL